MKSIEKIQEAHELLQAEYAETQNASAGRAISLIYEFIIDNEPVKKKGLSVWDFVSDDVLRPNMQTVFHDNERKVAVSTDAHVLFVNPDEYIESNDESQKGEQAFDYGGYTGLMRDKYGKVADVSGKFPNYRGVIPADEKMMLFEVREDLKQVRDIFVATAKLSGLKLKKKEPNGSICINKGLNIWVSDMYVDAILRAGIVGWTCNKETPDRCGIMKKWDNGHLMLIMPTLNEREEWEKEEPNQGYDTVNMIKFNV